MLPSNRSVRLLGISAGLVTFCESLSFFAATLFVFSHTHSALAVSALMATVLAADVAGMTVGGVLADKLHRQRLAVVSPLLAGLILLVVVVGPNVVLLGAIVASARLFGTPVRPAMDAALPSLAIDGEVETASGYVQALRYAAAMLGPIVAGAGSDLIGPEGLFVAAAAALGCASLVLSLIRGDFHGAPRHAAGRRPGALAGARFLRRDAVLSAVLCTAFVSMLFTGLGPVADLPYVTHDLGLGGTGFGFYSAAWSAGMVAGALLAPRVVRAFGPTHVFCGGLLLVGTALAVMAAAPHAVVAFAVRLLVGGVGGGLGQVAQAVLIARRAPDAVFGRVRATNDSALAAAQSISLAGGGLVVSLLGARGTYAVIALTLLGAGLVALTAFRRVPALAVR